MVNWGNYTQFYRQRDTAIHTLKDLLSELITLNDKLHVQAHLMKLELQDEWQSLQAKMTELEHRLEHSLVDAVEKLGHAEQHFYIDSDEDIKALVEEFRSFNDKVDQ